MDLQKRFIIFAAVLVWGTTVAPAWADIAVDLKPREGVTLRVAVIVPDAPKAVVILFAGGGGKLGIKRNGKIKKDGNFVVRTREMFARAGFVTMVPDVPSDRKKGQGLRGFRHVSDYTDDLRALMRHARMSYKLPVWFLGTSAGTISVAHAGGRLSGQDRPDGLVFTSSITKNSSHESQVLDFDLEKYTGPALIVHHQQDGCGTTPASGAGDIKDKLEKASVAEVRLYEGGNPQGDYCKNQHYHGFNGIEEKVVGDMA
ncbi:MAG: alpha/beta hydrolase, partial [Proteobacteria bacterium]|nr:alpha/beta hydrolase [Pseudomonadota bacterium]